VTARKKAIQVVGDTHTYVELVNDEDDFLSYWSSRPGAPVETKRIIGVDIPVPRDVPLRFMDQVAALKDSTDPDDILHLLEMLFGSNPLDAWVANDATGEQLQVILAWGMSNAQGNPIDFAEAAVLVDKARARDAEGKAPVPLNRAGRRASSRTRTSARTGR
jgi:hypothetical protein